MNAGVVQMRWSTTGVHSTMCTRHVKWYRFTGVLEYCMSTWFSEKYICTRVQQLNMGTGLQDWYRCIGV